MNIFYVITHPSEAWDIMKIIVISVTIVGSIIFPFVLGLLCFHVCLITGGLTTYEYVSKKYPFKKNPYNNGRCNNCANQLCGPEFPVFHLPELLAEEQENTKEGEAQVASKLREIITSEKPEEMYRPVEVINLKEKENAVKVETTRIVQNTRFTVQPVREQSNKMGDSNNNKTGLSPNQVLASEVDCEIGLSANKSNDSISLDDLDLGKRRIDGVGDGNVLSLWPNKNDHEIVLIHLPSPHILEDES